MRKLLLSLAWDRAEIYAVFLDTMKIASLTPWANLDSTAYAGDATQNPKRFQPSNVR